MSGIKISMNGNVFSHPLCGDVIRTTVQRAAELRNGNGFFDVIPMTESSGSSRAARQMIFRIKPQLFSQGSDIEGVLSFALTGLMDRGYGIRALRILSTEYAAQNLMAQRYLGFEHDVYEKGVSAVPDRAMERFNELTEKVMQAPDVLGGGQAEEACGLSVSDVALIWQDALELGAVMKLCPKVRFAPAVINGESRYILNGNVAKTIERLSTPGGINLAACVESLDETSADIREMKLGFLGTRITNESRPGSLRRFLFDENRALNLTDDFNGFNGAHLSGCVLEALLETSVWFSRPYEEIPAGRKLLADGISNDELSWILNNPVAVLRGKYAAAHKHTIYLDIDEALPVIKKILSSR